MTLTTYPQLTIEEKSASALAHYSIGRVAQILIGANNPEVTRVPATYAASTVIPWMRWMEMSDVPGHLFWHTSGEKLFSVDQLPTHYLRQAGDAIALRMRPEVLDR